MELTTGQRKDQVDIDIDALQKEIIVNIPSLRIFVDTIDEQIPHPPFANSPTIRTFAGRKSIH